jgi:hypothetical protein
LLHEFRGKEVLIIGGGASGVELAGLMSEQSAFVTVATRPMRIPFCGPPRARSLWERIMSPATGLGTGWRSWACVTAPMLFYWNATGIPAHGGPQASGSGAGLDVAQGGRAQRHRAAGRKPGRCERQGGARASGIPHDGRV